MTGRPRPRRRASTTLAAVLLLASLGACGKKGPPLPPLGRRSEPPAAVVARQRGADVELGFRLPDRFVNGEPRTGATTVIVLRSEPGGRPTELTRLDPSQVEAEPGAPFVISLPLERLFDGILGDRAILQVVVQGEDGKASSPSSPLPVVRADSPAAPGALEVVEGRDGIRLSWIAPGEDLLQYNVYRRPQPDAGWGAPRNGLPLAATEYLDRDVTFGSSYEYEVRSVAPGSRPPRESVPAGTGRIDRRDRFPPGPPTAVRAVAGPQGIRVFWFPPSDEDLTGFRLYRSTGPETAWERIAELPPRPPAYVDTGTLRGTTYLYAVTALDDAVPPNEGPRSESAEETATSSGEDR